jgi:mycothiol system anti-sigma-R factor
MGDASYNCQQALREIERFLDGELQKDVVSLLQRHLDDCQPCMRRADFQRRMKDLIATKCGGDDAPPDLLVRIRLMIQERDAPTG